MRNAPWGEAPLKPVRSMPAYDQRLTAPTRRRKKLGRAAALSFALHVLILLLFLIVLPETVPDTEPQPLGKGSPPSVAMVMDVGTAEGENLPAPSFAPAKIAPGEAPSMAPPPPMPQPAPTEANTARDAPAVPPPVPAHQAAAPPPEPAAAPRPSPPSAALPAFTTQADADPLPPSSASPTPPPPVPPPPAPAKQPSHAAVRPAPRHAPQVMTRNTLPVPPSHTTRQPNRTANNQGASQDSPGAQALNSEGAPPHSTNGPDPTTSTGGAAGEDGGPPLLRRVANNPDAVCAGSLDLGPTTQHWGPHPEQLPEWRDAGVRVPIRAHFYRMPDGTAWVRWYIYNRAPVDKLVTIAGSTLSWVGQYGAFYSVSPAGSSHFSGLARGFFGQRDGQVTVQLTCSGSDAHPFRD
jgi:hypothetical protein